MSLLPNLFVPHHDEPNYFLLLPLRSTPRIWWTGEDSNLRSPQGAADLQSAGFSHSPTRPGKIVASPAARKLISFSTGAATKVFQLLDKPGLLFQNLRNQLEVKTQIELVSKDTSPLIFTARIRSASFPEKTPATSGGAGGGN